MQWAATLTDLRVKKRQCSDKILDLNGRREEKFLRRLSSAMIDLIAQRIVTLIVGEPKTLVG